MTDILNWLLFLLISLQNVQETLVNFRLGNEASFDLVDV